MSKKVGITAIVLSVAAICLSIIALCGGVAQPKTEAKDIQYVMYLGTNDKDTYEPFGTRGCP